MWLFRYRRRRTLSAEIYPDEIFIDSSNVPEFDRDQFEGRIERPLNNRSFVYTALFAGLLLFALFIRVMHLQVLRGTALAKQAKENQLTQKVIFADRGVLQDRRGVPLAYNERAAIGDDFAQRVYAPFRGLAHAVGYTKAPAKDSSGVFFREVFEGMDGAEKAFNSVLAGANGRTLTETDVHGKVVSENEQRPPQTGETLTVSIDAHVTQALYDSIAERADSSKFQGGAGILMDIHTGEIIAMTSYPEYSQNGMQSGDIASFRASNTDRREPFLNRVTNGLYAPGSIVKPIVGAAALNEGIIDEHKQILSTGSISVPNPYDPKHPSIFRDWRVNGWTDVRRAIAVSSDVYFYEVGGGYPGQVGLGIDRLNTYFRMFGFGADAGLKGFTEQYGNIPTFAWKAKNFPKDPDWRLGNTYHTAIGQYGMQVTPLQAVRASATIANGGRLLTPTLVARAIPVGVTLPISSYSLLVVREGMRMGVVEGIAQSVKFDAVHVAAKTGTAQIGAHNEFMNSWMVGFFPYENPRYAFAVVLERGPAGTVMGSPAVMGTFFSWLITNAPEYVKNEYHPVAY